MKDPELLSSFVSVQSKHDPLGHQTNENIHLGRGARPCAPTGSALSIFRVVGVEKRS